MRRELPARPNIEHLKSQAKDLLDAARRKDPEAIERFREALPAARGASDAQLAAMALALHDAQSVIARELGFASWAELRAHVAEATAAADTLRALIRPHMSTPLPDEVQQALIAAMSDTSSGDVGLTSPLPLLPMRNAVLAAGAVAPLSIGRPASIAAALAARDGRGVLAVFAQKDGANEAPDAADLHPVGSAARLLAVFPGDGGGLWIVVRAVKWIRLEAIEAREPCLTARVAGFTVQEGEGESAEVARIEQALRARVRSFAEAMPDPARLLRLMDDMTALQLADATIANLPCSVEEKARYASEPSLVARLEYVLALCDRAA